MACCPTELVLKVRVAGIPEEADFIELQLPLAELSFDRLLRECCRELNIDGQVGMPASSLAHSVPGSAVTPDPACCQLWLNWGRAVLKMCEMLTNGSDQSLMSSCSGTYVAVPTVSLI